MPSLISGFEYDVFISYRHKDNLPTSGIGKHGNDGWVTEFVANLKRELQATFKEDVNVYFDVNPQDGLLETHNVEKSLEGKIKSVILIPIISQTYCDEKSFAWQYEFCAFNKLAKEDSFGRDIKLRNGNVACRILPVKIHELDPEDIKLLETELGGVLRSVEFIYKESGVNRPLRANERGPGKDQGLTTYRNQVNKVANSIKEIIYALKNPPSISGEKFQQTTAGVSPTTRKSVNKRVILAAALILVTLILIGIGYFQFYKVNSVSASAITEKSIAVLPFDDLSPGGDQEWFSDGLSEELLNRLAQLPDLKVTARTSSFYFKDKKATVPEIAMKLGVVYVVEGSVRKIENQFRITAQLIRAKDGFHMWSQNYDRPAEDLFKIQDEIAEGIARALVSKITAVNEGQRKTSSDEAYRLYLKGRFFWDKRTSESFDSAESYYSRALEIDPNYALAYTGLADCYTFTNNRKGLVRLQLVPIAQSYIKKALAIDSNLAEALTTQAFIQSHFEYDWRGAIPILQKAIDLNPNYPSAHLYLGNIWFAIGETEKGLQETNKALELDPLSPSINWVLARNFYYAKSYDLALSQLQKTLAINKYSLAEFYVSLCYMQKKDYAKALENFNNYGSTPSMGLIAEEGSLMIINCHALSGETEKAKAELREFLKQKPNPNPYWLSILYVTLGDFDNAMIELERGYDMRVIHMMHINVNPHFDPLRKDPRFMALIKKMNF